MNRDDSSGRPPSRLLLVLLAAALASACGSGAGGASDVGAGGTDAGTTARDAGQGSTDAAVPTQDAGPGPSDAAALEPRLLALSREGQAASLEVKAPFAVRAEADLAGTVRSARCLGARCVVVQSAPGEALRVLDSQTLARVADVALEPGSDPRDVALVDERTALVSLFERAALLVVDLVTQARTPIDLGALADADGLPEAGRIAHCGRRAFVQLRRDEHATGLPSALPAALAVVDLDQAGGGTVVQAIALADRPDFDMPVDCAAARLYLAEPRPLMKGGGGYEQVDLGTLAASDFPVDTGAEVGGFEVLSAANYWLITHTEFGPGPSSHLNCFGGTRPDTTNTFAMEHVNDLALDRVGELLFFPDPCSTAVYAACDGGVHVFHARTGELAAASAVKLGFAPIEVALNR